VSWLQLVSIAVAFLSPLAIWAAHRRRPHPQLERNFSRGIAFLLLTVFLAAAARQAWEGPFDPALALPMQLCDWTLFAVVGALLWRSQTCFEVGYFWGLCGTLQALFTPALDADAHWLRQLLFFADHAGIVAGVLFLLLVPKMRPRSLRRVIIWSELYLACALAVNALAGANYGFLSHQPPTASLLDLFSHTPWLYVLEINLVALLFFAAAYLPWLLADRLNRSAAPTPQP
jgi:hypothetical integral membrane protein (TIGR02206 family)